VIGTRRTGDGEVVEMAAQAHYAVPVTRSRAGWLKARIGRVWGGGYEGGRSARLAADGSDRRPLQAAVVTSCRAMSVPDETVRRWWEGAYGLSRATATDPPHPVEVRNGSDRERFAMSTRGPALHSHARVARTC
jgi:hypothetical protein